VLDSLLAGRLRPHCYISRGWGWGMIAPLVAWSLLGGHLLSDGLELKSWWPSCVSKGQHGGPPEFSVASLEIFLFARWASPECRIAWGACGAVLGAIYPFCHLPQLQRANLVLSPFFLLWIVCPGVSSKPVRKPKCPVHHCHGYVGNLVIKTPGIVHNDRTANF
jgi:hypothetical protein